MTFSFFQQIASGERAACLLDQPTFARRLDPLSGHHLESIVYKRKAFGMAKAFLVAPRLL
jgi:hypothetical protein